MGEAILSEIGDDFKEVAGSLQLCAGQENGIYMYMYAAIHAVRATFESHDSDGILLADASNASNSLDRKVCLQNVRHLCPSLAPLVINPYRPPSLPVCRRRDHPQPRRHNAR